MSWAGLELKQAELLLLRYLKGLLGVEVVCGWHGGRVEESRVQGAHFHFWNWTTAIKMTSYGCIKIKTSSNQWSNQSFIKLVNKFTNQAFKPVSEIIISHVISKKNHTISGLQKCTHPVSWSGQKCCRVSWNWKLRSCQSLPGWKFLWICQTFQPMKKESTWSHVQSCDHFGLWGGSWFGKSPFACTLSLSLVGAATSIIFVTTKVLSWQTHVCHDKNMFVVTKHIFCHDKSMLVVTKLLLQQIYSCCNKLCCDKYLPQQTILPWQNFCSDKSKLVATNTFVATKLLSQQTPVCRDKKRKKEEDTCASSRQWYFRSSHWADGLFPFRSSHWADGLFPSGLATELTVSFPLGLATELVVIPIHSLTLPSFLQCGTVDAEIKVPICWEPRANKLMFSLWSLEQVRI